jgi:hypothetical protein
MSSMLSFVRWDCTGRGSPSFGCIRSSLSMHARMWGLVLNACCVIANLAGQPGVLPPVRLLSGLATVLFTSGDSPLPACLQPLRPCLH